MVLDPQVVYWLLLTFSKYTPTGLCLGPTQTCIQTEVSQKNKEVRIELFQRVIRENSIYKGRLNVSLVIGK